MRSRQDVYLRSRASGGRYEDRVDLSKRAKAHDGNGGISRHANVSTVRCMLRLSVATVTESRCVTEGKRG